MGGSSSSNREEVRLDQMKRLLQEWASKQDERSNNAMNSQYRRVTDLMHQIETRLNDRIDNTSEHLERQIKDNATSVQNLKQELKNLENRMSQGNGQGISGNDINECLTAIEVIFAKRNNNVDMKNDCGKFGNIHNPSYPMPHGYGAPNYGPPMNSCGSYSFYSNSPNGPYAGNFHPDAGPSQYRQNHQPAAYSSPQPPIRKTKTNAMDSSKSQPQPQAAGKVAIRKTKTNAMDSSKSQPQPQAAGKVATNFNRSTRKNKAPILPDARDYKKEEPKGKQGAKDEDLILPDIRDYKKYEGKGKRGSLDPTIHSIVEKFKQSHIQNNSEKTKKSQDKFKMRGDPKCRGRRNISRSKKSHCSVTSSVDGFESDSSVGSVASNFSSVSSASKTTTRNNNMIFWTTRPENAQRFNYERTVRKINQIKRATKTSGRSETGIGDQNMQDKTDNVAIAQTECEVRDDKEGASDAARLPMFEVSYVSEEKARDQGVDMQKLFTTRVVFIGETEEGDLQTHFPKCLTELYEYKAKYKQSQVIEL